MSNEEKGIKPIDIGGGELMSPEDMGAMLGGTTGQAATPLESLSVYNQGKEDYWSFGEDEKKESVLGVFLYSGRPLRAFWHPDKEMDGSAPTCFSLDGAAPSELAEQAESDACKGCPWDKLGTAKVGKGKACKAKAADFIMEVPDNVEIGEDGKAYVDPDRILGPAVLRYSIANAQGPAEFSRYCKGAKEVGAIPFPQAVLGKWHFQSAKSKSGVKYSAIKLDVVAPLPGPEEDPALWAVIMRETRMLKEGTANEILAILSGGAGGGGD